MEQPLVQEETVALPLRFRTATEYPNALRNSLDCIQELKNNYCGKRCFVIGDKCDLSGTNWPLLANELTFCCEESYPAAIQMGLTPTFCINGFNRRETRAFNGCDAIPNSAATWHVFPLDFFPVLSNCQHHLFLHTVPKTSFAFVQDIAEGVHEDHNNILVALQLAYALGIKQLFLLGVGSEDYSGTSYSNLPGEGFSLAKNLFEVDGRVIIDITPQGSMTVFPKSDFDGIFEVDRRITSKCAGMKLQGDYTEQHDYPYLVSAVVSTYNAEDYITGCLEDLERQTIARQLEIIVVVSGSEQNEEAIVKEYACRYDNIKIIKTVQRESVYQAWNRAIKSAQGKYLTNANTDDRHAPEAFEKMVKALEADKSMVLAFIDQKYYREIRAADTIKKEFMFDRDRGPFSRNRLIDECFVGSQPMWRANIHEQFGYFDEAFFTAADYEFWLRISQRHEFIHINALLGERLIRSDSLEYSGNSYLSYIETAAIQKAYEYARLNSIPVDSSGLSGNPVFSTWCELNAIRSNTLSRLGNKEHDLKPCILLDTREPEQVPSLTIIITTFNRKNELLLNLQGLNSQSCLDFEVIVVNNGEAIRELADSSLDTRYHLCYAENSSNLGPSHARNLGVSIARSRLVAILDDDAIADSHWAASIIKHFGENNIAALRGKVRPKKDDGTAHVPVNYDLGDRVVYNTAGLEMNTAFRRDLFNQVGGYDNLLFGYEGAELSYRIFLACGRQVDCIKYFPDVLIYHDFPDNPDRLIETQIRLKGMKKAIIKKWPEIEGYISFMWGVMPANRCDYDYSWLTSNAIFCLSGSPKEASVFASQAIMVDDAEPLAFFLHGIALLNANGQTESGYSSLQRAMSLAEQKLHKALDLPSEMIGNYEMIRDVSRKRLELYSARTGKPHETLDVQTSVPQPSHYTLPYGSREQMLARSRQSLPVFKDLHRGQRCVIIGNGPSLNKMDLSFLEHEITFGMNRIYLLFDKWKFRPTYYVTVNPLVIEQSAQEIISLPMPKFVSHKGIRFFTDSNDIMFLDEKKDWAFSKDPLSGLHEGWTVTFVAMQLAYYMGFNEVVLIGVDHHFVTQGDANKEVVSEGSDPNHFHPDYFGKGIRWHLPDLERSEGSYKMAKAAFESDGRRIIDATVDGKLTIFPKADYRELFIDPKVTLIKKLAEMKNEYAANPSPELGFKLASRLRMINLHDEADIVIQHVHALLAKR